MKKNKKCLKKKNKTKKTKNKYVYQPQNLPQTMTYSGHFRLSIEFQTVKTVADCQDSCRSSRQLQTVSYSCSRPFQNACLKNNLFS